MEATRIIIYTLFDTAGRKEVYEQNITPSQVGLFNKLKKSSGRKVEDILIELFNIYECKKVFSDEEYNHENWCLTDVSIKEEYKYTMQT